MNIPSKLNSIYKRYLSSGANNHLHELASYVATKANRFNSLIFTNIPRGTHTTFEKNEGDTHHLNIVHMPKNIPRVKSLERFKHKLPRLAYSTSDLEPFLDAYTLQLHYGRHHAAYVNELNRLLETAQLLDGKSAQWLLQNLRDVPIRIRAQVRDNASGHLNHCLMWSSMAAHQQNLKPQNLPTGSLLEAINYYFGGFEKFKTQFEQTGKELLGSGWLWLVQNDNGSLQILTTDDNVNPITLGMDPLLAVDLWEHAYYLKYLNHRDAYLEAWWAVANWDGIEETFNAMACAKKPFFLGAC